MLVEPFGQNVRITFATTSQRKPCTVDIDHADMRRSSPVQSCIHRHRSPSCIEAPRRLRTMHEGG
jgi:hypothetical protein